MNEPMNMATETGTLLAVAATPRRTSNPSLLSIMAFGTPESAQPDGFSPCRTILSSDGFSVFGSEADPLSAIIIPSGLISTIEPLAVQCPFLHLGWFVSRPFEILHGDARDVVRTLPFPVDSVISSPPYFAQRTYGDSAKELGRENTVDGYIATLVEVFASIPLQPWASVWVNIGDKRDKDGGLLHIPERFLFAMEAKGFALVDKVIWAKEVMPVKGCSLGHGMIEPAPGRLNGNGWEPFYRFVRSNKDAWTDTCAVGIERRNVESIRYLPESLMQCDSSIEGRNLGNVWLVPTGQTTRNHYAVFPPALVERQIAMTCPPAVTELGPRERMVERVEYDDGQSKRRVGKYTKQDHAKMSGRQDTGRAYVPRKPVTRGWTLTDLPSRPGIVLDPFAGTATTGEVAIKLGRLFIGIELYEHNVKMAKERCENAARIYQIHLERLLAADAKFTMHTGIPAPALGTTNLYGNHALSDSPKILPTALWPPHALVKLRGHMTGVLGRAAI
jgi:site-specific DNA-methyltransferase (adenine-specific)